MFENHGKALMEAAERLRQEISIVAVIGETLSLKRSGRTLEALCPFHAEKTPSFHVYDDHYYCFGCRAHGDVFDWLMKTRGMKFRASVEHLQGGRKPAERALTSSLVRPTRHERSGSTHSYMRCYNQGIDPIGTLVEAYLRVRGGLTVPEGAPIRFHPHCQRGPIDLPGGAEFWPAMLALMTDPLTGEPVGLHRTFLMPDGSGKAPVTAHGEILLKPKMILGRWGAVRLTPDDQIGRALAIAEGIENALTASQIFGWGPVWAAGTKAQIEGFPVLPWIEAITVFADADEGGVTAARRCGRRWMAADREAIIYVPSSGQDWNEAANRLIP